LGNFLQMADKQRILALLELGWSYRRIERETGIRRETAARHDPLRVQKRTNPSTGPDSKADNVSTGSEAKADRVSTGPTSAAEPYRAVIEAAVAKGLTAQRIWQDLCADYGYGSGYASVKRFVRTVKRRRPEVADIMEHPPGQEAQVDYFQGPLTLDSTTGKWRRPWMFRMTLSCSRHGYTEALWTQDRRQFLRAHEHAFAFFKGVPKVVRHDNLRAAVVRACLYDPDVSEVYTAFATHWGFVPLPSRPYHPQENGIAENSGGYVKENALKGRRFDSLEELQRFLERWNRTIAQVRIHGTTRKQVLSHFLEVDQPALLPLAEHAFDLFEVGTRTVHPDGHVQVDGAFYSVPHYLVGQEVRVHWNDHLVRIYANGQAVAVHGLADTRRFVTRQEHRPVHKPAKQEAYQATLLAKAEHIGARALAWAQAAIGERDVRAYRLLQGMISLTRSHPRERVDWACGVALEARSFRYQTLRRLLEQAAPALPLPFVQDDPAIRDLAQYADIS
jgi:transposase